MNTDRPEAKKNKRMWVALWPCLFFLILFLPKPGDAPRSMGINQRLGDSIPKQLAFTDEYGKSVKLGDEFSGRPVVLVPIFYSCKTGCAILTDSIIKTLALATKKDNLKPGRDLDILMYSIDPAENADLAHAKKALIFNALTPHLSTPAQTAAWRAEAEKGWHLLTGSREAVTELSSAIGFKYSYRTVPDLEKHTTVNLINHPTCTVILTPQGMISSYTIGNEFQPREIESDLADAGKGSIGRAADQSWMFGCLMIDPNTTGKNRVIIENVWRLAGVLTLLVATGWILSMFINGNRESHIGGGGLSTR